MSTRSLPMHHGSCHFPDFVGQDALLNNDLATVDDV
jgi:hypothetical protein